MAKKTVSPETSFTLRNVQLSYPAIAAAVKDKKGNLKFSGAFVLTDESNVEDLRKAELAAARDVFGDKAAEMLADGELKSTWRRSKADIKKYGNTHGYVNARSNNKPGVVGILPDPNATPDPTTGRRPPIRIADDKIATELYPGAVVNVRLSAFYFDFEGNTGISFGLGNLQKVRDGKRLDNRKEAEEEFDADLSAAPADIEALK